MTQWRMVYFPKRPLHSDGYHFEISYNGSPCVQRKSWDGFYDAFEKK